MERKINFCYQAVNDIQTTIRAVDTKIGFLMVVIFIPIAAIKEIIPTYMKISAHSQCLKFFMWSIAAAWLLTIFILFRALWAIKNPGKSITGNNATGTFFNSANFKMSAIDYFFNYPIKSDSNLESAIAGLPNNETEILRELVYEKMKLEYIRDIKIKRLSASTALTLYWIAAGTTIHAHSIISNY